MGNTCCVCTDTSTDGIPNGKLGHEVEDYPLKGGDSVELPHISEREFGMYIVRFRFKSLCTWKILIAENVAWNEFTLSLYVLTHHSIDAWNVDSPLALLNYVWQF